ncbi:MAG: hypothetical protein INR64_07425 [Caulobacteraceae bacterium]|nr:hypothetical protein [Caulobacter sp.]
MAFMQKRMGSYAPRPPEWSARRRQPQRTSRMFHSLISTFFTPDRAPLAAALPGDVARCETGARGRHAQALAYAATRRRAAVLAGSESRGVDLAYWKAGVPAALRRAALIRGEVAFAPLP